MFDRRLHLYNMEGDRISGSYYFFLSLNYLSLCLISIVIEARSGAEYAGLLLLLVFWAEVSSMALQIIFRKLAAPLYLIRRIGALAASSLILLFWAANFLELGGNLDSTLYFIAILFLFSQIFALTSAKILVSGGGPCSPLATFVFDARYFLVALALITVPLFSEIKIDYFSCTAIGTPFMTIIPIFFLTKRSRPFLMQGMPYRHALHHMVFRTLSYSDVIILPFIFGLADIYIYLGARIFATTASPISLFLIRKVGVNLGSESKIERQSNFIKAAARINISLFLVGGGAALIPLAIGKVVSPIFGTHQDAFLFFLFWSVVAQSCSSIFGAWKEILEVYGKTNETSLLGLALMVGFSVVCFSTEGWTLENFIILHVAIQYIQGGISAGIVATRFGIWPGPTALLFGKLRLFQRTTNSA